MNWSHAALKRALGRSTSCLTCCSSDCLQLSAATVCCRSPTPKKALLWLRVPLRSFKVRRITSRPNYFAPDEAAEGAATALAQAAAEGKLEAEYDELYRLQNELLAAPRKQRKVMKKQIDLLDTEITQLRDSFKSSYGHSL